MACCFIKHNLGSRKDIVLKSFYLVLNALFVLKLNNLLLTLLFKLVCVFCFFNVTNNKVYYFVLVFINSFIRYQRRELKSTKKSQLVCNKSFNKKNSLFFTPQGKHEMHKIISIFSFLCRISSIFCSIAVLISIFSFL